MKIFPVTCFTWIWIVFWSDIRNEGTVQSGNCTYDTWQGDRQLEVWVSRIKADNLPSLCSESTIINTNFSKNHRYRTGDLAPVSMALIYIDQFSKGNPSISRHRSLLELPPCLFTEILTAVRIL